MSTATITRPPPGYTSEPVFRLMVDDYHDLIDRGRITTDHRVELVKGILVYRLPMNPPRAETVDLVADVLTPLLQPPWRYKQEKPITLDDGEPIPDGVVTSLPRTDAFTRHPSPADIGLVIQVAESTLKTDRGSKLDSYARAGIPAY